MSDGEENATTSEDCGARDTFSLFLRNSHVNLCHLSLSLSCACLFACMFVCKHMYIFIHVCVRVFSARAKQKHQREQVIQQVEE